MRSAPILLSSLLLSAAARAGGFEAEAAGVMASFREAKAALRSGASPAMVLGDLQASRELKEQALSDLRAHGIFDDDAARALLDLLEREKDPSLRAQAARVFYLLFYDVRGAEEAVSSFLLRAETVSRVERHLTEDPQPEVRREMAQLGQIMLNGFQAGQREPLAEAYLPLLVKGLADPDPDQRNEVLVALEAFRLTAAFRRPESRTAIAAARDREPDPDLKERVAGLLSP